MFYIVYPSGSHGSFLTLLLNTMSGISVNNVNNYNIYDHVDYLAPAIFQGTHRIDQKPAVMIKVQPSSYLKYFAMCLNRTANVNLLIDELGSDTFKKLSQHVVLQSFAKSLAVISGQTTGDVDSRYLREWIRLCFFADNGTTIQQFISPSVVDADYVVDFEAFYDGSILEHCRQIYKILNLKIIDVEVAENLVIQFPEKLTYYNIDLNIHRILFAIDNNTKVSLLNTNLLQQAWIDNYLVTKYNIDPLLKNDYFSDTQELRKAYNLL